MTDKLQEAKERLTIPILWEKLNLPGRPKPGSVCSAPWREDKAPSLSITKDGKLFKDHGAGQGGDSIVFLEMLFNIDRKEACKRIIEMAGLSDVKAYELPERPKPVESLRQRNRPDLPLLFPGSPESRQKLADLRGISVAAVNRCVTENLLHFCTYEGQQCWLITDGEKINAQVRKLDGSRFGQAKSKTLLGSWAKWPVGIGSAGEKIALVEGGPDFIAAFDDCLYTGGFDDARISPICMFGGGMEIHPAAIPMFFRKEVAILPHNDDAGERASRMWSDQLRGVANVRIINIPPQYNDLNDWVTAKRTR